MWANTIRLTPGDDALEIWLAEADGIYDLGCPAGLSNSPLYRFDPATGRSRLLGTVEAGGLRQLAVSPDGRTILFTKTVAEGADLLLIKNYR